MTIPADALSRFAKLQQFATIAMATSDGLRNGEVDHWRAQVSKLTITLGELKRTYGEVTVGENGEAHLCKMHRVARGNVGHRIESFHPVHERRPDLDAWTVPLFNAQKRLAAAREQQAVAGERAGAFRRAVDEGRRALQARGWREER